MIRVLLVDDHAIFRRGASEIIREAFDGAVIEEASTADEAVRQALRKPYDVVVLDISLPGKSGLEVLADLRPAKPSLPVLVVSMYAENLMASRVLKAGASGYLVKESAPAELATAIRTVLGGGHYVTASIAELLIDEIQGRTSTLPHERLSQREFEIFTMLGTGMAVTAAAVALNLSVKTVSTYRTRILDKMEMHTNAEIIRYAVQHRLVE